MWAKPDKTMWKTESFVIGPKAARKLNGNLKPAITACFNCGCGRYCFLRGSIAICFTT